MYTYPHVLSYRRSHSEHSWARSFWAVIKNGGDSDSRIEVSSGGRRRNSLTARRRKQKKAHSSKYSKEKGKAGIADVLSKDNESASAVMVPLSLSSSFAAAAAGRGNILDLMETEPPKDVRATDECNACDEEEEELGVGSSDIADSIKGSSKSGNSFLFPRLKDPGDDGIIISDDDSCE